MSVGRGSHNLDVARFGLIDDLVGHMASVSAAG